jgi:hypothetical protein
VAGVVILFVAQFFSPVSWFWLKQLGQRYHNRALIQRFPTQIAASISSLGRIFPRHPAHFGADFMNMHRSFHPLVGCLCISNPQRRDEY